MTAVRPYKPALSPRRAFEIMAADEGAFHPAALGALVRSLGLYPPGTSVELSSGERGVVLLAGADLERPKVRVTHDGQGRALPTSEQIELDLGRATDAALSIVRALEIVRPHAADEAGTHDACC